MARQEDSMTFNIPTTTAERLALFKRNAEFKKQLQAKIFGRTGEEHSETFCKEVSAMLKKAREEGIYPLP
jgi:hypothetical protein